MIEGSDPKLLDEVVIVSGHYDHNGADSVDIFNGADDNGSGTVGTMAIAQAYAALAKKGERPRRTVLFAVWDAEERLMLMTRIVKLSHAVSWNLANADGRPAILPRGVRPRS